MHTVGKYFSYGNRLMVENNQNLVEILKKEFEQAKRERDVVANNWLELAREAEHYYPTTSPLQASTDHSGVTLNRNRTSETTKFRTTLNLVSSSLTSFVMPVSDNGFIVQTENNDEVWEKEAQEVLEKYLLVQSHTFNNAVMAAIRKLIIYGNCCLTCNFGDGSCVPQFIPTLINNIYIKPNPVTWEIDKIFRNRSKGEPKKQYLDIYAKNDNGTIDYYVLQDDSLISHEVLKDCPLIFSRLFYDDQTWYGFGLGLESLTAKKRHDSLSRLYLEATEILVDAPTLQLSAPVNSQPKNVTIMSPQELSTQNMKLNLKPGARNYTNNTQLLGAGGLVPLRTASELATAEKILLTLEQDIKDCLMLEAALLPDMAGMTATEIATRVDQKQQLLYPMVAAISTNLTKAISTRVLNRAIEIGKLRDMGYINGLNITFKTRFDILRSFVELNRALSGIEKLTILSQFDPSILDNLNFDEVAKELAKLSYLPKQFLRDEVEVRQIREQRALQQQEEQQQQMQMQQQQQQQQMGAG